MTQCGERGIQEQQGSTPAENWPAFMRRTPTYSLSMPPDRLSRSLARPWHGEWLFLLRLICEDNGQEGP